MVTIDEQRWPLVLVHFRGINTPENQNRFQSQFETWLAKREPFALVIRRDDAEAAEAEGKKSAAVKQMRKDGMAWAKAHKGAIAEYCVGMAMVPDSTRMLGVWGPIVAKVTKNIYGCPGKVFESVEQAQAWGATQLGLEQPQAASATTSESFKQVVLQQRLRLLFSGVLAAIGASLGLIPYYLIYLVSLQIFDVEAAVDSQAVAQLALWAVAAIVSKGICTGLSTRLSHIAAYTILYDLRIALARKLGRLPLGYFTGRTTGEVKKIIHEDVEQLEQGLAHIIPDVVAGVTVPLVAGIVLVLVDWRMTLATLASAAIAIGLFGFIMSRFDMSAYNALLTKMNGVVIQYINGMKVVKAFTRTDFSFGQLRDVVEEMRQVYVETTRISALPMATMLTLMRSAAVTVVPVGIALYLSGSLSLPTFVLFVVMGIGFNRPIMAVIFHGMTGFYQVNAATQRIAAVFDRPDLADPADPQQPEGNAISFRNVSFGYGDTAVLKDISFTAPAGSVTALVGASGAGKSTIAKLIPRFWDVDAGEIAIGGVDIKNIAVEQLMNRVSFVFQDVFLFNDTILENIRIGNPTASYDEIIAAAKAACCDEFITALPQGYRTPIGENGVTLSGGQRQRLSIARAILKDAPIVVLDEATAYIDPESEALVQAALASLLAGGEKTLVVVAHRLSTIAKADRILVVDRGQIVTQGTHPELLEHCELYQAQWRAHISAQDWQFVQAVTSDRPPVPIGNRTETDAPLENPYATLDEADTVWAMMRKLVPARAMGYFWRAVRWRLLEGMAIGATSYLVYLVLVALFQAEASGVADARQLWGYAIAIFALCIAQIALGYRANTHAFPVTIAAQTQLRMFLADYLRRLPLGFFTRHETGTIDALFTTNVMYLEPHQVLESVITAVVTPLLIFAVMLAYDWRLALVLAASVPVAMLALSYGERVLARVWRVQAGARVQANARMVEYIQGISVIRAFNLAGDRLEQFRASLKQFRDASLNTVTEIAPALTLFTSTLELGFALLLVVGASLFAGGSLTGDRFLFFMVLGLAFYTPLLSLADMMELYHLMQNCVRNLNEFMQSAVQPVASAPQYPQDTTIEFRDVSFRYEDETVLDRISLTIAPGSMTALVGTSGSGKTTITNLIARFWDTSQGSVTLGGADVRQIPTNTLLAQMTMVFQDVYLFNDTILANIQFGNPDATEAEVFAAAEAARCHGFISRLPQGYQTMVGEGGATLSGGEKQRISIARAMLKDAPIVLLDEATASIDPENERSIQQAIQALSVQKTLIVIAHRLNTIAAADQILVLDRGRIVERGQHAELLKQGGLYQQLWEVKARSQGWKIAGKVKASSSS
ncbi:MAG: ABC transporter ATP-binding protein [Geitlerinemataceae cyanobacterium]